MQILEPVIKNEKNYLEFKDYAISRRVIEKEGQDKNTGFDLDSAKIIVKELDGKYKKVFEEYSQYNQRLFKYMKDSGYISKEFYQKALEIYKKMYGDSPHLYIANSYNNLGSAYDSQGAYEEAIKFYQKCIGR